MNRVLFAAALLLLAWGAHAASPQSTAFTYQGTLSNNGVPVKTAVNLTFKVFDAATNGNQIGSTISMPNFPVNNGSFTTDLDFQAGAFTGNQLWLEVTVGTQILSPRQQVNTVPVAQYAMSGGSSTIVPFSSGLDFAVTTTPAGSGQVVLLGFGNGATTTISGGAINLTGSPGTSLNFAFSIPRDGTITGVSAFFSNTTAVSLVGTTLVLNGQLYASSTPDNTFTPIAGTNVVLAPFLTGFVPVGSVSNGILTGLSIPVSAQTRLLFVGSASSTGVALSNSIQGYWSAGLTIQ